ncbi:hypothetical protein QQS21_000010 [Conoideocrella luteorostrata]|uniref:Polyketide synthase 1 n=1 Tax=Conoideocrella luteorostrata TaxID=1105319 RepID=A0AAJ0CZI4_9HYPO|nr:hypothetical protein QQS21_000010 [Conoideocrella luteorostrata]
MANMRAERDLPRQILIFGDQNTSFLSGLQRLLLKKDSPSLVSFIDKVHMVLRQEISQLSTVERQQFPSFISTQELLAKVQKGNRSPAIESVLLTVYQLCCVLNFYDNGGDLHHHNKTRYAVGLCVGSLAATVVSSSKSLFELITAGIDAVKVAFRVGLRVSLAASTIGNTTESSTPSSWSHVIPNSAFADTSVDEALLNFKHKQGCSDVSAPYLSAAGHNTVTISGPHPVVKCFSQEYISSYSKSVPVGIYAPYHAPHIYTEEDVDAVLSSAGKISDLPAKIPVISGFSGQFYEASTFRQLLQCAIRDMLLRPLDLGKVSQTISSIISRETIHGCSLLPVATSFVNGFLTSTNAPKGSNVRVDNSIMTTVDENSGKNTSSSGRHQDSKIAIVGMSGRFPDAADLQSFWELLYQGLDVHRRVPDDRFNAELYCDPSGRRKNTSKVMNGCWIKEPGLFDPKFFNMSPKEAEQSDPGQRLALQTAYEALEMAGIVPDRTPSTQRERVGVFYGMTSDDWREVNSGQNVDTYFIPGGNRAFTPGRLNYFFKFSGPSASIDTACSSSLAAIHMACNSLWTNDCDTAIAGGTNVLTNPDNFAGLDRGHFLSRTGNCNTFDDAADGYCRADGVGTVILKRLEDAQADKDPILGIIVGAYTNHSAESVSITRPHAGAQEYMFSKLLHESGVHPHEISYIEMHGTGTQAGDATEMASVLNAFAPGTDRLPHESLHLGSAKSNIGHGESASGVTALIKVLLMMQQNTIPPHCGIKGKINHKFPTDFEQRNVHIALAPTEWKRPNGSKGIRRVFVDNFSAAGGNTALLVEDAPLSSNLESKASDERSTHIVTVSAKSGSSLKKNIQNLMQFIKAEMRDDGSLSKLSYTTTARRMHHTFRLGFAVPNTEVLLQMLQSASQLNTFSRIRAVPPSIGFVFSGQGAQYTGMGRQFFHNYSIFRSDVLSYDSLVRKHGFPSVLPLIDGSSEVENLSPLVVQLGTVCLQMALATLWKSFGIETTFVIGHSLGQFAALKVSGVLSASDAIFIAGTRAKLLQDTCNANTHAMLAVRASLSELNHFIQQGLHEVACVNGTSEVVLCGEAEHIERLSETLAARNIKGTQLKLPFAFHSSQVDPILEDLYKAASSVQFHPPTIPVGSALLSKVVHAGDDSAFGPEYIKRHCREPVLFANVLQDAVQAKIVSSEMIWIEIGPHSVCSSFLKSTLGTETMTLPTLRRNEDAFKVLADAACTLYSSGLALNWGEYHRDFSDCQMVLQLPSYSWDNENYWIQYNYDWTLTKGDPPEHSAPPQQNSTELSTSSVQRILQDSIQSNTVTLIAQSDFGSELLREISQGHRVNGANLCTSSLYADIGLTLGKRLLEKYHPELRDYSVNVQDMNIDKTLVLKNDEPTLFRAEVTHDKTTLVAKMSIYSVNKDGKKTLQHSMSELRFEDPKEWAQDWKRNQHHILRSIGMLRDRADQGLDTKLSQGMIYKLFSSLVDYNDAFKGLQKAVLHSQDHEATATVKFQTPKGDFFCNPMWIDSCGQLTGFLMNGHETTGPDQVFINHGWKSLRLAEEFRQETTYQTYIRMCNVEGTKYSGDLYIVDDNRIIGVYGGITFLGISRRVLNVALPPPNSESRDVRKRRDGPMTSSQNAPATETTAVASSIPAHRPVDNQAQPILSILSEEIGVPPTTLEDSFSFADYGVDSLLSLTITGRMREDLGIDVDSAVLLNCTTLGEFISLLGICESPDRSSTPSSMTSGNEASSHITTPDEDLPISQGISSFQLGRRLKDVCGILAEEIGVSHAEIEKCSDWLELGLDSLLSLTILGRFREELDLTVDADFFVVNYSFSMVRDVFQPGMPSSSHLEQPLSTAIEPLSTFRATSTLLQGSQKKAKYVLFLYPDGSGSATSYGGINSIGADVCVYGLNCPWLKTAEKLVTYGLSGLATLYVEEMKRRQPHGPYNIGGWSAGGICAYEAAIQMTKAGDVVERLILLDSPNPIGLEKLPPRLFDFFNGCGVFGDDQGQRQAPEWLLNHFLSFIEALDRYKPIPWQSALQTGSNRSSAAPQTHILWAEDGVCKNPTDKRPEYRDNDPREMRWLLENRTNFGFNGWDQLVGEDNISIKRMQNANHFTMMKRGPNTAFLAAFLRTVFT